MDTSSQSQLAPTLDLDADLLDPRTLGLCSPLEKRLLRGRPSWARSVYLSPRALHRLRSDAPRVLVGSPMGPDWANDNLRKHMEKLLPGIELRLSYAMKGQSFAWGRESTAKEADA